MKSKFISLIVAIAVTVAMVAVPVAVPGVALASSNVTVAIDDATTYALPLGGFTFDAVINNPSGVEVAMINMRLDFDPTYFTVDSVALVDFVADMGAPTIDNGAGTISYDPHMGTGNSINLTTLIAARMTCTAKALEGVSTVDWVYTTGPPPRLTKVVFGTTDYLEGGNMSLMTDGTVIIGSPKLTVDVSPAGKGDVDITGSSIPSSYPNVTEWAWDQVVTLEAVNPAAGWAFENWTGDLTGSTNPDTVTMDSLAKSVTANFVELPPELTVDTNSLAFSARFGDNEDNGTVEISNTGGGTLCWALGTPPVLAIGNNWAWLNMYGNATETLTMLVTDDTDADVYDVFVNWTPSAVRMITVTDPPMGPIPAISINATAKMDKFSLEFVQQNAVLSVFVGAWVPATAELKWTYNGCHGWPYELGKSWSYDATQQLVVMGVPNPLIVLPTAYATVTAYTNVSGMLGPLGGWYWETTHYLNPMDPANSTFMQTYWDDATKCFAAQWDGGTFTAPPVDIRVQIAATVAPEPPAPPAWLSFDKVQGSLGISGAEDLTVTASTSTLPVGVYNGSFTISAGGSIQTETIDVTFEVLEATTIDVIRDVPADALDPDAEYPGDSFYVYVNFTAPVDNFNAVGVTDLAPAGWDVATDVSWCSPVADWTMSPGNKAEYAWNGPYSVGQNFSAMYLVTIPATADVGLNDWPDGDCAQAWAEYWFGAVGPFESCVTGEWQKLVTVPGTVCGETRDVNADLLTSTMVILSEQVAVYEDDDSSTAPDALYCNDVDDTGMYWQSASKYCYFTLDSNSLPAYGPHPQYLDFSTVALLAAGYTMDFEGNYGLVPRACTMSYAMESVNHWLFTPIDGMAVEHSEWQLSNWKAMESVHSWQFPAGCNL